MYLFFDTETTGLSHRNDHVVQIAWVLTDAAGNIKVEECHVIRPNGYSIPPAAARIHGITTAKACEIGQDRAAFGFDPRATVRCRDAGNNSGCSQSRL